MPAVQLEPSGSPEMTVRAELRFRGGEVTAWRFLTFPAD